MWEKILQQEYSRRYSSTGELLPVIISIYSRLDTCFTKLYLTAPALLTQTQATFSHFQNVEYSVSTSEISSAAKEWFDILELNYCCWNVRVLKVHGRYPRSCTGSGNLVPSINLCSRLCEISEFSVRTTRRCDVSTACRERLEIPPKYYDTPLPTCSEEFVVKNNIYHKYTYKCIILYQINDYWRQTKTRKK